MNYEALLLNVMSHTPFARSDEAGLALTTSLETLGFLLPERMVQRLESALPAECTSALWLGRSVGQWRTVPNPDAAELHLHGHTLERVQAICAVLGKLLPPELVQGLIADLPPRLAEAFDGSAVTSAPHLSSGRAHGSTRATPTVASSAGHLSEARVGSEHPLCTARPTPAQQDSVAAENPHGDTKLSSARGGGSSTRSRRS
jgi:uncharacterized protein (DUF2267 family)